MMSFIGTCFAFLFIGGAVIVTTWVLATLLYLGFWTLVGYYYKWTWDPSMNVTDYVMEKFKDLGKKR